MDVIGMQDIRAVTIPCIYCKSIIGGKGWLVRCSNTSKTVYTVYSTRVASQGPLHPTVATALLDLLHVAFPSIGTTMEPNQSPRVANILVFQDHFMKHMLVYVTPDQTTKTIAKFLYWGYISIFRAPARLLSDRHANFMSNVMEEMCKILGMTNLWTMPYHPQTNGLVERSCQMIMHMIRKLKEDKKLTGHHISLK